MGRWLNDWQQVIIADMSAKRPPYRITVAEYDRMVEHGILTKEHRVELIRGELVAKMPIGDPHAGCVKRLNKLLGNRLQDLAVLGVQDPVQLADSKPEPDVSILRPREDFYAQSTPRPADVYLLIEVADSTLDYDREVKAPLYAENGIAEYWIVNLEDKCFEVYRQPRADGTYADVRMLRVGDMADIAALPGVAIAVAEVL
jgi:Uma2 family endonuclease